MESEQTNNNKKKISKEKLKQIPINKQYLDDSETYEYSSKYKTENSDKNNSLIEDLDKNFKKSIGFFPKKIFIEKPDTEEKNANKRKYSLEQHLIIKDFVPQLRPIEIHLVPSKLRLNKKGFKDLKCNKDNKILLMSNNYFISCPNSEEESDICVSPFKNNIKDKDVNIKNTRKILQKMKSGSLPKVMSRNLNESNYKLYKDNFNIDFDSEKDSFKMDDDDDNLLLYDDNDFIKYNTYMDDNGNNKDKNDKKEKEGGNPIRNNRMNSCSILDVLKNRLSFDETI